MVYYGVSMNTNFLGGDLYSTFIFGAAMEIPAVFSVFFLIDLIGRKALLAGGFTTASLCLLSNLFLGDSGESFESNVRAFCIKCIRSKAMFKFQPVSLSPNFFWPSVQSLEHTQLSIHSHQNSSPQ